MKRGMFLNIVQNLKTNEGAILVNCMQLYAEV